MPTLSLYSASVPNLINWLSNLEHILKLGESNAAERKIDSQVFLDARLAPDMATLIRQVQIACSLAKACPFRITGEEPPVYEDTEASFADLYALIAKAKGHVDGFSREQIDGLEDREFSVKLGPREREFTGITYVSGFILPNIYFHITTAYNILRHNGVPLGKMDYFGGPKA